MDAPCRFFVVGSSIFIMALEAALIRVPEVTATRAQPNQLEQLPNAVSPALVAILFERNTLSPRLQGRLSRAGYALISLDAATTVGTRADGRKQAITSADDLFKLIQT